MPRRTRVRAELAPACLIGCAGCLKWGYAGLAWATCQLAWETCLLQPTHLGKRAFLREH